MDNKMLHAQAISVVHTPFSSAHLLSHQAQFTVAKTSASSLSSAICAFGEIQAERRRLRWLFLIFLIVLSVQHFKVTRSNHVRIGHRLPGQERLYED
jgi:uncharacterized membrane protein